MCLEKRVFYRMMSGLHSSINIHLSALYLFKGESESVASTGKPGAVNINFKCAAFLDLFFPWSLWLSSTSKKRCNTLTFFVSRSLSHVMVIFSVQSKILSGTSVLKNEV